MLGELLKRPQWMTCPTVILCKYNMAHVFLQR